jgi:transcriptional regulator with XRE-family HTH domain
MLLRDALTGGHEMATQAQLEEFAKALKQAREAAGLSIRELGRAVSVSHTVVWQWENAEHAPRRPRVRMIEHVLGLPTGSLQRLLGQLTADEAGARVPMTVLEAAEADSKLGERGREILAAVYRELVRKPVQ